MMSATISTTTYTSSTSAMYDAGRQPLATIQSNTPESKRAVNPWANLAPSPAKAKDVPNPQKSVEVSPSTLRRVPRVKRRVDFGDPDDEDLPLSRVKELMVKLGRRPAPIRFVPGPVKHTLLRPATIPMTCIVPKCPFDWHNHVNAAASH
ncbi:hypothetical protein M378DRAFT_23016 [Amanita muscaria Koide BX008]|uniref:Uncharacterized protein n=1 Tax=Amanita muscaria (strain Koide BX008) TaxID=946122 RepID=A0A0C2WYZ3_AMAMK|nr:hypothetical protein M378DRAFT_23016 [Amanita muscaria Koide BX008]